MLNHFETLRDWFLDSVHQHSDNFMVVIVSVLWAHGDELDAILAAAGMMLLALLALLIVRSLATKHVERKAAHAPLTMQEALFETSFINVLREHQEGR